MHGSLLPPSPDATQITPQLLQCPNEVLLAILHLCSPTDLGSVCRVNKRLNGLANTLLYGDVQFRWTDSEVEDPPVALFLRSILARPQLAEYTQRLSLVGVTSTRSGRYLYASIPKIEWTEANSTLNVAVGMLEELKLPHGQKWIQELRNGTMDAVIALLLARLPNLRFLLLNFNFTKEIKLLGDVLRSSVYESGRVGWLPRHYRLEEVSANFSYWRWREANTPHLLPLFYLPAIKRLDLAMDNNVLEFSWPKEPPNLANLTSLTLRNVREPGLKHILSATKQLTKLDWEFTHTDDETAWERSDCLTHHATADLDIIVDSLLPIRSTLEDLTIRASVCMTLENLGRYSVVEVCGSLARIFEFDKITRFEVPLPFLAGTLVPNNVFRISERMPRNIQILAISCALDIYSDEFNDPNPDWDAVQLYINLRSWFYKWRCSTPHFRRLELVTPTIGFSGEWLLPEGAKEALEMLCAENGVQVSIDVETSHYPPFNLPPDIDELV